MIDDTQTQDRPQIQDGVSVPSNGAPGQGMPHERDPATRGQTDTHTIDGPGQSGTASYDATVTAARAALKDNDTFILMVRSHQSEGFRVMSSAGESDTRTLIDQAINHVFKDGGVNA